MLNAMRYLNDATVHQLNEVANPSRMLNPPLAVPLLQHLGKRSQYRWRRVRHPSRADRASQTLDKQAGELTLVPQLMDEMLSQHTQHPSPK